MSFLFRLARGSLLCATLAATAVLAQSPAKQFFRPQVETAAKRLGQERPLAVVSEALPVEFNAGEMLSLVPGEEVEITLPSAVSRKVVFELAQAHGGGIHSWVGYFKDRGNDARVILTTGPAGSFGVIDTPDGSYRIVPGEGHDWLVDMTQEQVHLPLLRFGDDALASPKSAFGTPPLTGRPTYSIAIPGVNRVGIGKGTPELVNIDLLVVVTKGLAERLGAGLLTRLNFLVTRANTAYADSEVGINLRLVGVTVVSYSDTTSDSTALRAISPQSGSFDAATFAGIETVRAQVNADMVAFLRNGGSFSGSGVAWVGDVSPNPALMYSVTTGCVTGCESVFIHELGHNMGNMHDRATVAYQAGGTTNYGDGAQPYAYGYAFCKSGTLTCNPTLANGSPGACPAGQQPECSTDDPSNFSDIMAYFHGTTNRIYKFSSPAITCVATGGDGVARPCGLSESLSGVSLTTGSSNTALSMNSTRTGLSAIHTGAANPPGILQFTNTAFSGSEAGGAVQFTVSRSNGSGGAVSVAYSIAGGTATAGTDFSGASGTVSWADGNADSKTISVPLTSDGAAEGIESFTMTLANPSGGATLGYPVTATGLILEPWPPGGTAPAGFSSAATPTRPWAVATDSFDGTADSASFKSGAFTSSATGNSSTQYTGHFAAGTIAFAYRVSSYPGNGFFEFLVDNVVVLSDSGDSGWKFFSTAVTAGAHTFEWRYRKTLSFFCANAIPAPPQGAACADRAWIDSVSLPAVVPNSPRLVNIATRGKVQTGDNVMIAGFIIGGSAPKKVLITARGPSLAAQGVPGTLANPFLQLFSGATQIDANDDWQTRANWTEIPTSMRPSNPQESAILATLNPGAYTAIVSGVGQTSGIAIAEVFEVEQPDVPLANIATRARVETGDNVMIAGLIVQGDAAKKVLITARGPSLAALGVPGTLADPQIQLYSGATLVDSNDDFGTRANAGEIPPAQKPSNAKESAILTTLNPGAYTVIVSGVGGTSGIAIVEVFAQ